MVPGVLSASLASLSQAEGGFEREMPPVVLSWMQTGFPACGLATTAFRSPVVPLGGEVGACVAGTVAEGIAVGGCVGAIVADGPTVDGNVGAIVAEGMTVGGSVGAVVGIGVDGCVGAVVVVGGR